MLAVHHTAPCALRKDINNLREISNFVKLLDTQRVRDQNVTCRIVHVQQRGILSAHVWYKDVFISSR